MLKGMLLISAFVSLSQMSFAQVDGEPEDIFKISSGTQVVKKGNETYQSIFQNTGKCTYTQRTAVRKVVTASCGPAGTKRICHVDASCEHSNNVQGSCFVSEYCPQDPIECLARRDITVVRGGAEAVGPEDFGASSGTAIPKGGAQ